MNCMGLGMAMPRHRREFSWAFMALIFLPWEEPDNGMSLRMALPLGLPWQPNQGP